MSDNPFPEEMYVTGEIIRDGLVFRLEGFRHIRISLWLYRLVKRNSRGDFLAVRVQP